MVFAFFVHSQVDLIVGLYTADPILMPVAATLLGVVALAMFFDGGQAVMVLASRGRRDVWIPMAFQVFSFVVLMVPIGWFLAFKWGMGVEGLIWAVFAACLVSMTAMVGRFHLMSRRSVLGE